MEKSTLVIKENYFTMMLNPRQANGQKSHDFSKSIGNFYRMAISSKGDKIAVVSYKGERP